MDEHSGLLRLQRPLDRTAQASYTLTARAVDQGVRRLSSVCHVSVSVMDINNNPPVFERREYSLAVPEDVSVGTQVLRVFAARRDTEAAGEVTYAIVSGNERGVFSVEPQTGARQSLAVESPPQPLLESSMPSW